MKTTTNLNDVTTTTIENENVKTFKRLSINELKQLFLIEQLKTNISYNKNVENITIYKFMKYVNLRTNKNVYIIESFMNNEIIENNSIYFKIDENVNIMFMKQNKKFDVNKIYVATIKNVYIYNMYIEFNLITYINEQKIELKKRQSTLLKMNEKKLNSKIDKINFNLHEQQFKTIFETLFTQLYETK